MLPSNPFGRLAYVVVGLVVTFTLVLVARGTTGVPTFSIPQSLWHPTFSENVTEEAVPEEQKPLTDVSYDLNSPPSTGCEDVVNDLQQRLIQAYTQRLKGIRYANIWGYLETENKGDAAIWSAQQMMLATLGIETMEACRFMHKGCNMTEFTARLDEHRPHSGIIMAGGGNFNDYYWEDQPSRMEMISTYTNVPIRAFPQSIHMTKKDRIEQTREAFGKHHDLQLAARDKPSHDWLVENFGKVDGIETDLVPDIAFMWGNRSDFRVNTQKKWDVLILARKDAEIAEGDSSSIPWGKGFLDLGSVGNVTYNKVDWKFTDTPHINGPSEDDKKDSKDKPEEPPRENGTNQRAWAKSIAGFELLGSARFVITDRLHGHIMSTVIGVPHVLMDSKLGKNLNFHNTWTRDCKCTRVATSIEQALDVASMWFAENEDDDDTFFL
ncbi:polysaccharide pyruvyl transferase-domain-containing protein [Ilyonectria robusta]|uniref:polysaccharide pyruvyl transferase-domain-containing protein n=1 Tax=Ilyonectria robusta TaxID=1079257 RepID=UPI001E8EA407|nr:polysaccharide pyruvyl transferase-domain-containing protein [Ilyonectria robusta]KAH8685112.1 polysaccharide pyruvyl transferase-domain-containing protein [Ilyonectria robusta]